MTAILLPFPLRERPALATRIAREIARDWGLMWPLDGALVEIAVSRVRDLKSNRGLAQAEADLRRALGAVETARTCDVALRRDAAPAASITVEAACDRLALSWRLQNAVGALWSAIEADSRDAGRGHLAACGLMIEAAIAQCQPADRRLDIVE